MHWTFVACGCGDSLPVLHIDWTTIQSKEYTEKTVILRFTTHEFYVHSNICNKLFMFQIGMQFLKLLSLIFRIIRVHNFN